MEVKSIKLEQEVLDKLSRLDASIHKQSVDYGQISIRSQQVLAGIHALYEARKQIMDVEFKKNNIDPETVTVAQVTQSGDVFIQIEPKPAPGPSNGQDQAQDQVPNSA
jgi:hypothetical protein